MNSSNSTKLLWSGLVLAIIAFVSYPLVFARFAATRDFPWATLLLFAVAAVLVFRGIRDRFQAGSRKSKVIGLGVAVTSGAVFALFVFMVFISARQLPSSQGAPKIGQKAPDFTLPDTQGRPVALAELRTSPAAGKPLRGVLLVFYRGYW